VSVDQATTRTASRGRARPQAARQKQRKTEGRSIEHHPARAKLWHGSCAAFRHEACGRSGRPALRHDRKAALLVASPACGAYVGSLSPLERSPMGPFGSRPVSVTRGGKPMSFTLPDLPYSYDALTPHMSRETLEYHHDKHHLAYVNNGNNLLKGTEWEGKSVEEVVIGSFGKNAGLFNNAGQHYNHIHFWKWMKPGGGGDKIPGKLEKQIISDLGSVAKMKEDFIQAGVTQFGSGWCWLAVKDGRIIVMKTPNGENPLVHGAKPILGCDVWEHSYYIDYRNRRPDYLKAFMDHLVNWDYVAEMYEAAIK
jgi:Fe-Mn family superoxide dismutase